MSSADNPRPDCSFCGGGGLPILPVRYAVARSDDVSISAPELPADLEDDAVSQIALSGGQHYTLRLLREGFLYVFNAARGRWQGYYVTDEGFLSRYIDVTNDELLALDPNAPGPLDADINAPVEDEEFPCRANPDHVYPGRCITVPAAQEAEALYFAFSDDRWTKRVWKEHATNENGRRDSMRKLSMPQWKGGSADYTRPLSELGERVAEANFPWIPRQSNGTDNGNPTPTTEVSALSHSLAPVNGMRDDVEGFVEWSQRQAGPSEMTPALFVLDDPAGVTSDLAALLDARENEFNEQEAIKRPFVTAGVVNALRDGFRERARMQRANEIVENHLEHEYYRTYGGPPGMAHAAKANFERRQKEDPAYRRDVEATRLAAYKSISEEELEEAADDAWGKYGDKLRPGEPDDWMENTYRKQLSQYDTDNMRPLASAYVSWLTGNPLLVYLNSRFDDKQVESGIPFVSVISFVLLGTQSYAPAFKQYVEWLSASEIDNSNLLLRGMGLNQKALIEQIMSASDVDFGAKPNNPATLPWGPLIAAYLGLTEDYPDEVASPARMLGHVLGPMQSVVAKEQNPTPFLLTLGMISGSSVQITQTSVTFEEALSRTREPLKLIHPDWGESELRQFQQKMRVEARSLIAVNGEPPVTFDIRQIDLTPLEEFMAETSSPSAISLTGRERLEFSAGIVGVALSGVTMWDFFTRTDSIIHGGVRVQGRFLGMGLALGSGLADVVGKSLEHAQKAFQESGELLQRMSKSLLKLGARFGLAGGLILGAMDLWEGGENVGENKPVIGALYITSGLSTVGATLALFLAGIGAAVKVSGSTSMLLSLIARAAPLLWWGGAILGVVAVAATVAIWFYTEDDLQEWLAECAFGERGNPGPGDARLEAELQHLEEMTQKEA
ncbi:T6SS effector BTH_I2691 family protein [Chromohalobacter sp. 11-W]|uniref:T6SS effector BTH_I2691 family protein n=1 Tax=Chromohalobacter sp. 11-W TaxID=2994061 RepID=UPI002469C58E|nr:T6SS effector BTH_I2691 family protein [Chromohalobacter sp. 11-W]